MNTDVSRVLFVPELNELAKVLQEGLEQNYSKVSVTVVPSPTFPELSCSGFGGNSAIVDVGGVNNMEFVKNNNKFHFDMKNIANTVGINGVVLGAAACKPDCSITKDNSELMPCLNIKTDANLTKEAYVDHNDNQKGVLRDYPHTELSSLGNLFLCEDVQGEDVIKIEVSNRTGKLNFVNAMRLAILNAYGDKQIGMGGTFTASGGKVKTHIMPTFPKVDSLGDPSWLNFYEVETPILCLSVFVSNDIHGDELRLEHTHFWSKDGSTGGHYHTDVTPETISYEGYYKPCKTLWRIGKALVPQQ